MRCHRVISGCGSAWLERLVWDQEVAGSNPVTPMFNFGLSGQDVLSETWAFWALSGWSEVHLSALRYISAAAVRRHNGDRNGDLEVKVS